MNTSPYFRFCFALVLLLLLGVTVRVHAATPPTAPQRAQETTSYLAHALGFSDDQTARLQKPMLGLVRERDALARQPFASTAKASTAHMAAEYHFFAAIAGIFTPNQLDDLITLHVPTIAGPEPCVAVR